MKEANTNFFNISVFELESHRNIMNRAIMIFFLDFTDVCYVNEIFCNKYQKEIMK